MKKNLLIAAGLFMLAFQPIMAQTIDDGISLVQEAFGKDKNAVVEASMELPEVMAPAFWAAYGEYKTARLANGRERIKIISDYLVSFANLGEAEADTLTLSLLKNDIELALLDDTNYKKATSLPQTTMLFYIDAYIQNTIRNAMQ